MKKRVLFPVLALLIMTAFALSACGGGSSEGSSSEGSTKSNADYSDSKYVGTWKALDMSLGDESETIDDDWLLTLNADGTGVLTADDDDEEKEEPASFTWEPVDGGFKTGGDVKLTFKDDGDKIKTNIFGVDLTFAKQ